VLSSARTVTTAGVVHPYLLSVPRGYRPTRPTPLVLLFHGYGSDGRSFAALTRMPAEAARRGVIVVTPDGPNHTWQLSGTGTDAAFVDAIVATLAQTVCVDLHRVYAAGFSQGAAFAIFYSCARPGRIAALATVAVDFQLGCKQPVPYLAFHGTADPAVPYDNGAIGVSLPGKVRGTLLNMSDWARLDTCAPLPITKVVGTEVTLRTWPACTDGTAVELYTIIKGSHTWPGADPKASPLYTTQEIDATALMLEFFTVHRVVAG
jgi:polyhydroxybutyrate depolymerase